MVTASHNGGADNGAKIVDPDGGMLASDWENLAAELANCGDVASVESVLSHISLPDSDAPGLVVLGRDTRVSSPHLATLVASGVAAVRGEVHDLGIVTTPQVHWAVLLPRLSSPTGGFTAMASWLPCSTHAPSSANCMAMSTTSCGLPP
jgi:phosphoacetylglucosamine mutase